MSRILFLIPHPDDEVVSAATFIRRNHGVGGRIFGLYLTCGMPRPDGRSFWRRPGGPARIERRRDEARAVASALGIEPVGFCDWPSRGLKDHLDEAVNRIGDVIATHDIDTIWVSAWEGGHQDHDVANFLACRCASGRPVVEFAEYNLGDGAPRWHRFAVPNGSETVIRLTPEEAAFKRRLLDVYRSERTSLRKVRMEIESCRPLAPYDYTRPPHAGTLSREKYRSIGYLFVRSRVDPEPSTRVYEALRAFGDDSAIRPASRRIAA
jgi:LmbE family N-acetylglucosaminyl deacetylase